MPPDVIDLHARAPYQPPAPEAPEPPRVVRVVLDMPPPAPAPLLTPLGALLAVAVFVSVLGLLW